MNRLVKSYLGKFSKSNGFEHLDDSDQFEHFCNFTVVEPKSEHHFNIEDLHIGQDNTIGIDGYAILLNKQLITSTDELNDYLDQQKNSEAEVIFIQSKTSPKFETKEIGNFGFAVKDFVSEKQSLSWTDAGKDGIELFGKLVERIPELRSQPSCKMYYITLGQLAEDPNIQARVEACEKDIIDENIFSEVSLELVGANTLINLHKKIGQSVTKSFNFKNKITLSEMDKVKEAYIGTIDSSDILDLMTDEDGELANVFYDNVRDYQGSNKVNTEIAQTLQSAAKSSFAILNNGIAVVAESLSITRDQVTISNYQIINGCQTCHVLYENKEQLDETVAVPIKLIISDDEELTSAVIRSTNRQTEVKEQDLLAYSNFQKMLEDYYGTYPATERLYYERRSKQYSNKPVERKRIVDKTMQIKAVASLYYDKPELATRYFGTVFAEFKDRLFKDDHKLQPYFTAAFALFRIEQLFKSGALDKKYRKIKYHLLMMLRHEIQSTPCPDFTSKKSEIYCQQLHDVLKCDAILLPHVTSITQKIDSLGIPLDNNEVSKSKDFVNKCLSFY